MMCSIKFCKQKQFHSAVHGRRLLETCRLLVIFSDVEKVGSPLLLDLARNMVVVSYRILTRLFCHSENNPVRPYIVLLVNPGGFSLIY